MASVFKRQQAIKVIAIFLMASFLLTPFRAEALPVFDAPHTAKTIAAEIVRGGQEVVHTGVSAGGTAAGVAETGLSAFEATQKGTIFENITADQAFSVTVCNKVEGNFFTSLLDNFGNALATTGDQTKTTGTFFISKQLTQLRVAKETCWSPLYDASERVVGTERLSDAVLAKRQNFITAMKSIDQRIADLEAQQRSSLQDVFKALGVSLILELNKNLTTKVVNDLKDKYKIGKYLDYADALATQVYAVDYIKKNYASDPEKQLIMSSLLKARNVPGPLSNNLYYKTAQTVIEAKVSRQCPDATTLANWNSADWYQTVNNSAAESCNQRLEEEKAREELQNLLGVARQAADQEIGTSNGFKSTRSCKESAQQNGQLETDYKKLAAEVDKAKAVVTQADQQFKSIKIGPTNPGSDQEIAAALAAGEQAKAAYKAVLKNAESLPKRTNGGVVKLCESISSPGNFLANSINQYLGEHLQQTFNLKSDNLPLYGKILGKYTSNFITNILLGKDPSQVLQEGSSGLFNAGVGAATGAAISNIGNNGGGSGNRRSVSFADLEKSCAVANSSVQGRSFKLIWNLTGFENGKGVIITPAIRTGIEATSGEIELCLNKETSYTFTVFDKALPNIVTDTPIFTDTVVIDPTRYIGFLNTAPKVAGAQTIQPRGPATGVNKSIR